MASEAGYRVIQGEGIKILTSKQTMQFPLIVLALVKVGSYSMKSDKSSTYCIYQKKSLKKVITSMIIWLTQFEN